MDWRFGRTRTKTSKKGWVGICETSTGIAAVYGVLSDSKMVIKAYIAKAAESLENKQAVLKQFVADHELQSVECVYVLSPGDYSLHLVDEPLVPKEEVLKAMRWVMKDLINVPIDEAILDVFDLPFHRASDSAKMVYTAVVKKSTIATIESLIAPTGMALTCVDIPELSLKNLMQNHPQQIKGCAVMLLGSNSGKLLLMKNQQLCIARSFDLALDNLGIDKEQEHSILEALALEVQRLFDYMNSVFRQSVQNVIVLVPTTLDKNLIQTSLKNSLGTETIFFSLSEAITIDPPMQAEEEAACLLAAGALLRYVGQS